MLVQIRSESRLRRWHCIFCSALFKGWSTCYPSPTQPPTPNPQPPTHTHSIIKPVLQPHRKQSLLYVTGRSLILAEVNKCTSMEGIFHRQAADNGAIVASSGSTSSAFSQDLVVGSGSTVPVRAYVSSPRWMCYAAETMWNMEHNQWGSCLFFFFSQQETFFFYNWKGINCFQPFWKVCPCCSQSEHPDQSSCPSLLSWVPLQHRQRSFCHSRASESS